MTSFATFFQADYPSENDVRLGVAYDNGNMVGEMNVLGIDTSAPELIEIVRGDSYDDVANPKIDWTVDRNFDGWTGLFTIRHRVTGASLLSKAVTVVSATELEMALTTTDTAFALLTSAGHFGPHPYDVQMTLGASVVTQIQGIAVVKRDQTYT